jgi:hypothetical protein
MHDQLNSTHDQEDRTTKSTTNLIRLAIILARHAWDQFLQQVQVEGELMHPEMHLFVL